MRIVKAADYKDMSKKAADLVAAQILLKPYCVLGLATGSTPSGMYGQLVKKYQAGELDFSGVRSVNLDEYRGLERSHDQSYYYYMHEELFDHVNIDPACTWLPDGMAQDVEKECADYEALVESLGGVDLQVLGMGHNGHIGFNEPGESFPAATHCVDLTESTIGANKRFFASAADVPRQAFTMGIGTIMKASKILLLVSGAEKARILKKALCGPVTPQVPASVLQLHRDVTVIADQDALGEITQ